ncbi:MAG: RIP metalloprotease RseP [Bacteroidales bacterium]|nr:RIP metalloprotease RseP [Bacteroidales bacterium]
METAIKIIQFLLSISILVLIHELGHFTFAKLFKTRVEKFYLFFNPWFSLFKIKKGDTEYGLGWLPLGGFVKISGMIDESLDREQLKKPAQDWEFRSKSVSQRFFIMFGGVLYNIVFAWFIYSFMLAYWGENLLPNQSLKDGIWCVHPKATELGFRNGDKLVSVNGKSHEMFIDLSQEMLYGGQVQVRRGSKDTTIQIDYSDISDLIESQSGMLFYPRVPMIVGVISDTSINAKSGLLVKDKIIAVNNNELGYYDEFAQTIAPYKGDSISVTVLRENTEVDLRLAVSEKGFVEIIPAIFEMEDLERFGIYEFKKVEYSILQSIPAGIIRAKETLMGYIKQFKLLFQIDGAYKSLGGFISMGSIFPSEWDWQVFWELTALLSVILGFMNFLPIPALDGGHILFLVYEIIRGKKPSDTFLERAQIIGMTLLFALLLLANGNDLLRLFSN